MINVQELAYVIQVLCETLKEPISDYTRQQINKAIQTISDRISVQVAVFEMTDFEVKHD